MPVKISIIGCGWLGAELALKLKRTDAYVVGTTTSESKKDDLENQGIEMHLYDHMKNDQFTFDLSDMDVVIYSIPPSREEPNSYLNSIKCMYDSIGHNTKVIFLSSIGVYPDHGSWNENENLGDGSTMLKAERIILEDENCTILRLAGLIGGRRHPIKQLQGRSLEKNGLDLARLVHREDVIEAIMVLIKSKQKFRIIDVIYPMQITKAEYYRKMAMINELQAPKFLISSPSNRLINSKNASRLKGFSFQNDPMLFKFETKYQK